MNKKLFLGMFAAAGMLLATSCQNDELDLGQSGNEATISFNLGVEDGAQTRAISDGKTADRLVYAVFNEKGERITTIAKVDKTTSFPTTETITLAKGQTYKVAFWAQNSATSAYVLDDAMNLTIDYTSGTNNAENRDAFFKTVEFTVTGNQPVDVVLKRPFAQINVGVTEKDWNAAVASGIEIATSKVVIKNAATKMSLLDGSIPDGAFEEITYDFGATPKSNGEVLSVDLDGDGTAEPYNYLSMSYILVYDENGGAQKALLEDLDFTFHPLNGNDIVIGEKEGLNSVPVQRNWRTNIIGQLLTGDVEFKISIDPIYDGENNVENGTPLSLGVKANNKYYETIADAINDGATEMELAAGLWKMPSVSNTNLKITGANKDAKIDLSDPVNISGTSIDFNNVTIVKENENYVGFQHAAAINYTDCVFENEYWAYGVETFQDCVFNQPLSGNYNVWTYGAKVATFKNCTFYSAGKSVLVYKENGTDVYEANFSNCKFVATTPVDGKAAIEIDGHLNPYKVVIENCNETGFALGSVSGNSLWNVKDGLEKVEVYVDGQRVDKPVEINGTKYGNIKAALAAVPEGGTATIELAEGIYNLPDEAKKKNLTFISTGDVAETIIECNNLDMYALQGSKVVFKNITIETDNGYLSGFAHVSGATFFGCIIKNTLSFYNDGTDPLEFENCTFHASGDNYNFWSWGASANFKDCTFNSDGKGALIIGDNTRDFTFSNCTFNDYGGIDGKAAIETGDDYNATYNIHINTCTVNGFDVTTQKDPNRGGDDLGTNVWGNKNLMTRDKLNVYINGTEVY